MSTVNRNIQITATPRHIKEKDPGKEMGEGVAKKGGVECNIGVYILVSDLRIVSRWFNLAGELGVHLLDAPSIALALGKKQKPNCYLKCGSGGVGGVSGII
ncbi:hypothetical protein CDAR_309921 [Caerostris darwini]|uniref:Uncharacterized protein n=1 Tax=Caerostris darwini TaxID=1538125 RepID=A0AAV4VYC4_9ARAC|nr:hypothetical protein CDAR_309921 [Caerostris darwini]